MPFLEFGLLICVLALLGLFFYIPQIRQYGGAATDTEVEKAGPYLELAHNALKEMFDHQLDFKSHNSWVNVSFDNMSLFNKDQIWPVMLRSIPSAEARLLHPPTYALPAEIDDLFQAEQPPYILKQTHKWGREGLLIVDSKEELMTQAKEYDIAQPLLQKPHLINGYKYDIRMFLVVHHKHGVLLHRVGYFSYSNSPYNAKSKDMFARIGGVHLTAEFYQGHGLPTSTDTYPGYNEYYEDIVTVLKKIIGTYPRPLLSDAERKRGLIKVFGIDINVFLRNGKLVPMLIEMNSNPCLLFPEAEWKNKIIYELVLDIKEERGDRFSVIRGL